MSIANDHPKTRRVAKHTRTQPAHDGLKNGVATTLDEDTSRRSPLGLLRRAGWAAGLAILGVAAVLGVYRSFQGGGVRAGEELIFHTVQRMDLPITVVERGNLESQQNIEIMCKVDDVRRDSINGTPIVWIIENGSSVNEGDLLVELDSSPLLERVDEQILDTERARALEIQTASSHENQITQNQTSEADAELRVRLAELELEMFVDEDNGTHKLEVEQIRRTIDDVNNEILAARANLELKGNDRLGIESLFKLGYAGKSELQRSRLDFLQAESQYAAKLNRLSTQLASLEKKETYERDMELLQLHGSVETAKRNLRQAIRNNEARLAQVRAAMNSSKGSLKKESERLARYQEQLAKCKIYAPQDGMVAYAVSRSEEIREGVAVRQRQHILSLPNLTRMQVKTAVHESVLNQIEPGLLVTVHVDAFPQMLLTGTVHSVAVLPDQSSWSSADTKVYETIVLIDEDVSQLKPGMTAVADIHIAELIDVVAIPVQAVVQANHETWCYVEENGGVAKRAVEVGRTNDKFIEIPIGLRQGERVVLNPMSIIYENAPEEAETVESSAPSRQKASPSPKKKQAKPRPKKIARSDNLSAG